MRRVSVLISILAVVLAGHFAVAWTTTLAQPATPPPTLGTTAAATLQDTAGRTVGTALLAERPDGTVYLFVVALGLAPGDHGVHAHETGACDPGGKSRSPQPAGTSIRRGPSTGRTPGIWATSPPTRTGWPGSS